MSASHLLAPLAPPVWMRSTATAASVHPEGPVPDVKKVRLSWLSSAASPCWSLGLCHEPGSSDRLTDEQASYFISNSPYLGVPWSGIYC